MGAARPALGFVALLLIAGSLVMLWFVILSAVTNITPLNKIYFLRADTSGITGARDVTQWAFFRICGQDNTDCRRSWADPPIGRAWAPNPTGAPDELVGSHGGGTTSFHYFYMWRFGWAFFLIALFFETIAFFAAFIGCCGRLGAAISGLVTVTALFFLTIAVSLMTAVFVQARDAFHRADRTAEVGRYAFGFSWASWAALLLATVLLCAGAAGRKDRDSGLRRGASTRSRKSYDVGGRRVKDDYS